MPDVSEDHTAPPTFTSRRPWRSWRIWLLAALIGIAATVAGVWMTTRHQGRQTRLAHRLVEEARVFMAEKKWADARPLIIEAFQADQRDPQVLRLCAFYELEAVNNLEVAGFYLSQLEKTGLATDIDRAMLGRSFAATGRLAEARAIYDALPPAACESKEAIELESLIAMRDGDLDRATSLMRRALAQEPGNQLAQLKLAMLDLDSPFPEIKRQAVADLMKIARDGGLLAASAAMHLAAHPALRPEDADELLRLAPLIAEGGRAVRFAALRACIRFHPEAREALLDRETMGAGDLAPEQLAELCRWLNAEGEHQRVLQFLDREKTEKFKVLFTPFVVALLRGEKWSEIAALLDESKKLPINSLNVALLRAGCAHGNGAPSHVVRDFLEQARRIATSSREPLALDELADITLSLGQDEMALDCLRVMKPSSPHQQELINSRILSIQLRHGDLDGALTTLAESSNSPWRSAADAERLIYFKLVAGVEQETVMDQCEQLAGRGLIRADTLHFFRALHAYRQGDRATLREALAHVQPATLPTNWRGVCAGLLAVAGEKALAFQLAEKIIPAVLTPDEQRILAEAL